MTRIARTFAATAVAALALCAAATAGGPTISAGLGCSAACIESAIVMPTASSASIEIRTSVPASVTVKVTRADAQLGLAAGPAPKDIVVPPFQTLRTVLVPGLEPETTYRIVVSARDFQGRVQTRSGSFTTRKVKLSGDLPDLGLSSGLGCKVDCLERGTLTSNSTVAGRARLELRSAVPATFQVLLTARRADGTLIHQLGHSTGSRKTEHDATLDGLLTGTRYTVTAKATDAQGRTWSEEGSFRTRSAVAVVTYDKLVVLDDGDSVGRGEIAFSFHAGGTKLASYGFRRLGSGDTFAPRMPGTSRPGIWTSVPVDGTHRLTLAIAGDECDWQRLSRCPIEAGGLPAHASTALDLRDAFVTAGALPAEHDAYVVFEGTGGEFRLRAYATIDVRVV